MLVCTCKKKQYLDIEYYVALASIANYKHLSLTLSKDLTLTEHRHIIKSVSTISDVLKILKYDMDKNLDTTYFSFIRPKLKYALHVWDNCI